MRVILDTQDLTDAVTLAAKVAALNGRMKKAKPILGAAILRFDRDGARVQASNLELELDHAIAAKSYWLTAPGVVAVDAAELKASLPKAKDSRNVELYVDPTTNQLILVADQDEYGIDLLDPTDHPCWDRMPAPLADSRRDLAAVSTADFAAAATNCAACTDPDSTRYALAGILIEPVETNDRSINLVGTDGRRMLVETIDADLADTFARLAWQEPETVKAVPSYQITLLASHAKLIAAAVRKGRKGPLADDRLSIERVDDGTTAYRCGPVVFRAKHVHGRFPNYRAVRPSGWNGEFRVDLKATEAIVARAARLATRENRGVHLLAAEASMMLAVDSETKKGAFRYRGHVAAHSNSCEAADLYLDANYLLDALKANRASADADQVTCRYIDRKSPFVIESRPDDAPYRKTTSVVMPLNRDR
ncbi:DNA polymerase III subunit beta [Tautonia sp. JC769]|uniref:DNA polymerase III subunit beta n=1 Tax=Tautonia sp. JC769 TaxID=3232135 RepID=UPI00345B47D0